MSKVILLILCPLFLLSSVPAQSENAVSWTYALTSLGEQRYRYDFSFYNLGPERDAIFKIAIGQKSVSSNWITILFGNPTGWVGNHPNSMLGWSTANGDITSASPGVYRLWGQAGAPTGPGATSATFRWTFLNVGGPDPLKTVFNPSTVKIHLQPISAEWVNAGGTYVVTAVPEPGGLFALLSGVGLTLTLIRRRLYRCDTNNIT